MSIVPEKAWVISELTNILYCLACFWSEIYNWVAHTTCDFLYFLIIIENSWSTALLQRVQW